VPSIKASRAENCRDRDVLKNRSSSLLSRLVLACAKADPLNHKSDLIFINVARQHSGIVDLLRGPEENVLTFRRPEPIFRQTMAIPCATQDSFSPV
jgi:hypothetical protein